jgi:monoamine oxidase
MADIKSVDVVIVGGGLAGLSAALRLKDAEKSVVLLESEARFGGRTLMRIQNGEGYDCEFGGGYVGTAQNYIQYLLRRFRIQTFRQHLRKDFSWLFQYSDPERIDYLPGDDPLDVPGKVNGLHILGLVDTLALDLRTALPEPWKHPLAELDALTVEQWIEQQRSIHDNAGQRDDRGMSRDTEDAFRSAVRCAFSLEPRDLSFFFLLYYSACAGSFAALVDVAGGEGAAEGTRLRFGTLNLVNALRAELTADVIRSNARVEKIEHRPDHAIVCTNDGEWRAQRVIIAMSPPASTRIAYDPPLDQCSGGANRLALCAAMDNECLGRTIKGFVRFADAAWRKKRLMGFLLSAGPHETCPLSWTLDNVWNPGKKDFAFFRNRPEFTLPGSTLSPGFTAKNEPQNPTYRLMTFLVGDSARYWSKQPADERARAVINHVQKVYGLTDADLFDPHDVLANYQEENWVLHCEQGVPAPAAMMPPGALTKLGAALREPVGVLHWAGSESAQEWCGYMSGAVESGFRAANEVLRQE